MAFKIEWTEPALKNFKTIAAYIEKEWSKARADKFVEFAKERIQTLSKYPQMGMASRKRKSVRSIKLSKHTRLYYRVERKKLVLLSIFDTRQNPDKNFYG